MPSETHSLDISWGTSVWWIIQLFHWENHWKNIGKSTVNEGLGWKNHEEFFLMLHYPCLTLSNSLSTHQEEPTKTYLSTRLSHRNSVVHWIGWGATFGETLRVWRRIYHSVLDVEWWIHLFFSGFPQENRQRYHKNRHFWWWKFQVEQCSNPLSVHCSTNSLVTSTVRDSEPSSIG